MIMQISKFSLFLISLFSTAVLCACDSETEIETANNDTADVLVFGGGDHHDFSRWFHAEDSTIIAGTGADVQYTDDPQSALQNLSEADIFVKSSNQVIDIPEYSENLISYVNEGNGLILLHAATWFIWDWPDYYSQLIGGGTSSHGPLGEFEVYLTDTDHPLTQNMPERFSITDELYRFQRNDDGAEMHVLAMGVEPDTGDEYPVIWVVEQGDGRVLNITLGHDGDAHQHEAFITLLENSIEWLSE